jgi:membrane-associated phospholipid phosphatase
VRALKHYTFVDYATQSYVLLVGLLILLFHNQTVPAWGWLVAGHAAGLAAIHGLIQARVRKPECRILDFLRHFYPVLTFAPLFCETGHINRMFFTGFLDHIPIRFDQAVFGCQPGAVLMNHLPWLPLSELLYASYFSYYLMIGGVGLALFVRNREHFFHYISVISFVFYVCYLLYIILPIIGPQVLNHEIEGYSLPAELEPLSVSDAYPASVKTGVFFKLMAWIYREFEAPGAALPSSHVAIAIGTVFFSFRYLRAIRWAHLAVACLLCFSTVYCHYHYVLDVLTGVLAAVTLIPLGNWLFGRSEMRQV